MAGLNLKDLARHGAIARLAELRAEEQAILKVFPDLRKGGGKPGIAYTDDGTTFVANKKRQGRRRMSAAERKAVSLRMKSYWAKRRKKAA